MGTMGIAIAMGIYYWFACLRFGYTLSSALLQPATIGVFVGLLTLLFGWLERKLQYFKV